MRNAATTYASSASTDVVAYEDLPGHHILAIMNLIATTNDESYHSSASELPPATSHGYAEWDFSSVPDSMTFQRFLNAADYWFSCSDDSSAGSYDPVRECFMVVIDDQADGTNAAGDGDGEAPRTRELVYPGTRELVYPGTQELVYPRTRGQVHLQPRRREVLTSTRSWLKRASSRQSSWRNIARCNSFAPPSLERPPRAANARVS
jgi:hypothetical protein